MAELQSVDPNGVLPTVGFLKVPEGKVTKNQVHFDLKVSGGRHIAPLIREERVLRGVMGRQSAL